MELPPVAGFPPEVDVEAQFNIRQYVEVECFSFNVQIKHREK